MDNHIVTIIGAGNIRCGPPVLATLTNYQPEPDLKINLFDANTERLDLAHLLAARLFEDEDRETNITATTDIEEALYQTNTIILTLNQDCAQRMVAPLTTPSLDDLQFEQENYDFRRGDSNRPTKPEDLSPETRKLIARANTSASREESINQAVNQVLSKSKSARIVSLLRGIVLPDLIPHTHLNWPAPLDDHITSAIPFQILRWIRQEDSTYDLRQAGKRNPLFQWLVDTT